MRGLAELCQATGDMSQATEHSEAVAELVAYFADIPGADAAALDRIYDEAVEFWDPLHRDTPIRGRDALRAYFVRLNANVAAGGFEMHDVCEHRGRAYLHWTMRVTLKRPRKQIELQGCTRLALREGRVVEHRDFFDVGAMVYEQVPVLRGLTKLARRAVK